MEDRMALVDRVKNILLTPRTEWTAIEGEAATVASIYTGYVIPLAAIPALAGFIGLSVVGISMMGTRLQAPMGTGLTWALVEYLGSLAAVYVLALVIDALAPNFGGQKNQLLALKVAAYSATASWVAGVFRIIPSLSVLGILGLYSLYLLYLGLPALMKAPADKAMGYTVVVVIAAVVIFFLVGTIASRAVGFGGWGMQPDLTPR
jgi:hypothetical protein